MVDELINNENWVDMAVGEAGTVFARLNMGSCSLAPEADSFVVTFSDWSQLLIECDRPFDAKRLEGEHVMVRVIRIEDGVRALAIWKPGSVPIPLQSGIGSSPCRRSSGSVSGSTSRKAPMCRPRRRS